MTYFSIHLNIHLHFSNLLTRANNQGLYFLFSTFDGLSLGIGLILPGAPRKKLIFTTMSPEIQGVKCHFFHTFFTITYFNSNSPPSNMDLHKIYIEKKFFLKIIKNAIQTSVHLGIKPGTINVKQICYLKTKTLTPMSALLS